MDGENGMKSVLGGGNAERERQRMRVRDRMRETWGRNQRKERRRR